MQHTAFFLQLVQQGSGQEDQSSRHNDIFKKSVSQLRLHAILSAAADVHTRKKASVLHHDYLHVDTLRDVCALFPLIVILIPQIVVFNMLCRKERVKKVAFF